MSKIVLFWILLGGVGFAFALAVQMRMMIALVLRRALKTWNADFEDRLQANQAVMLAAASGPVSEPLEPPMSAAVEHLRATYPNPIRHLQTARRYSVVTPIILLVLLGLGRTVLGAF